jgi:hypothetical protein
MLPIEKFQVQPEMRQDSLPAIAEYFFVRRHRSYSGSSPLNLARKNRLNLPRHQDLRTFGGQGTGQFDQQYQIDEIRHSFGMGGYTMQIRAANLTHPMLYALMSSPQDPGSSYACWFRQ